MAGDFNICEPEQGRFIVWNQTFTDGDAGQTAVFLFFSHVFEIAQPDFTRKDVTVNGVIRTCPELTGYLLIFLWLSEARDFHCYSHVFENLGERSIPWLHRFKLPNLAGNLSPRVEEGG